MKILIRLFYMIALPLSISCNQGTETVKENGTAESSPAVAGGQENVKDDDSQKDVVKVAISSKDH
ncbi:MAG: fasciclin domain-containing protein, partial [Bacteroidota bacterium]